jgi:hypothetical protein
MLFPKIEGFTFGARIGAKEGVSGLGACLEKLPGFSLS